MKTRGTAKPTLPRIQKFRDRKQVCRFLEFLMRIDHRFQNGELPQIIYGVCNHITLRPRGVSLVLYDCLSGHGEGVMFGLG